MDNNSRAPLGDKTNAAKEGNITSCQILYSMYLCMVTYITIKLTAADAKEHKRERDRARWREQKDAINKRRREKYHQRKNQHVLVTTNCNM